MAIVKRLSNFINIKKCSMTHWTITFIVLAIIAGILGFGEIGSASSYIGQAFFVVFLILTFITVIIGKIKVSH